MKVTDFIKKWRIKPGWSGELEVRNVDQEFRYLFHEICEGEQNAW